MENELKKYADEETKNFSLSHIVLWNEEFEKTLRENHNKQEIIKIDREIKNFITKIYYKRRKLTRAGQ